MRLRLITILIALLSNFALYAQSNTDDLYDSEFIPSPQSLNFPKLFGGFDNLDSVFNRALSDFEKFFDEFDFSQFSFIDSVFIIEDFDENVFDFREFFDQYLERTDDFGFKSLQSGKIIVANHSDNITPSTAYQLIEEITKETGRGNFSKIVISAEGVFIDNELSDISAIRYLRMIEELEGKQLDVYETVVIRTGTKI